MTHLAATHIGAAPFNAREALLAWYDRERRDLPFRRTQDPYAIWVSEVMLQQTQVQTVLRYYPAFMERFPTIEALAQAQLPEVLGLWRGLGYYTRAKNLHRAAQTLARDHRGRLPPTAEELRTLPGFGRYTAGAVASIAFGEEAPVVDGNVARVLSRFFALDGEPGERGREEKLWQLAQALVRGARPGDFNQALMELGARVCVRSSPTCLLCPLRSQCRALEEGRVDELPRARVRAARKKLNLACAVVRQRGKWLLARREERGLFPGLWELPCVEATTAKAAGKALGKWLGVEVGAHLGTVTRVLTHRDLTLWLFEVARHARLRRPEGYAEWSWLSAAQIEKAGISSAMQAAISAVASEPKRR